MYCVGFESGEVLAVSRRSRGISVTREWHIYIIYTPMELGRVDVTGGVKPWLGGEPWVYRVGVDVGVSSQGPDQGLGLSTATLVHTIHSIYCSVSLRQYLYHCSSSLHTA